MTADAVVAIVFGSLIAVRVRRLHDAGFSGGFSFVDLIPWAGGLIVPILSAMPSDPRDARFDR